MVSEIEIMSLNPDGCDLTKEIEADSYSMLAPYESCT
jgi:hypothetical protein